MWMESTLRKQNKKKPVQILKFILENLTLHREITQRFSFS